ncbi:arsenite methyltransferase [Phycicoccus sp. CSK15P-2]|uniref:arsenite methyltransferase n=1 Tax=Phycicoccus sp. CSK15P-2 TaxID=2807627 RepID=UPI00195013CB|nr:arsenite methyltransferase [Phycicoccus sp. CSK15P-2]MBM6405934.1 arsenite methyltransferase [Phycicoccus sp. CSK15P-2]
MSGDTLRADVREKYETAASTARAGACCGPSDPAVIGAALYTEIGPGEAPDAALLASLGCGNPTAVAELHAGETVLDLGSGGGLDVILSARRVGATGRAYGVDALDEMLELARDNAREAGVENVEFLEGTLDEVPLPDGSIDIVISNCVINLAEDKPAVFAEIARLLRPGGRLGVSDVVAEDDLGVADRADRGSYADCVAGALSRGEYVDLLAAAGFTGVEVSFTHEVADRMHGAIIRGRR